MMKLLDLIKDKKAKIAVVGLGYVGLPLAVEMGKKGFVVWGVNRGQEKVDRLLAGDSYIIDVAAEDVRELQAAGRFRPTTDFGVVAQADVVVI